MTHEMQKVEIENIYFLFLLFNLTIYKWWIQLCMFLLNYILENIFHNYC